MSKVKPKMKKGLQKVERCARITCTHASLTNMYDF